MEGDFALPAFYSYPPYFTCVKPRAACNEGLSLVENIRSQCEAMQGLLLHAPYCSLNIACAFLAGILHMHPLLKHLCTWWSSLLSLATPAARTEPSLRAGVHSTLPCQLITCTGCSQSRRQGTSRQRCGGTSSWHSAGSARCGEWVKQPAWEGGFGGGGAGA